MERRTATATYSLKNKVPFPLSLAQNPAATLLICAPPPDTGADPEKSHVCFWSWTPVIVCFTGRLRRARAHAGRIGPSLLRDVRPDEGGAARRHGQGLAVHQPAQLAAAAGARERQSGGVRHRRVQREYPAAHRLGTQVLQTR